MFVHESSILLLPPPTCIARTIAIILHVYCTIFDPLPIPRLYAIHHTILFMAISCKAKSRVSAWSCRWLDVTRAPDCISISTRGYINYCVTVVHATPSLYNPLISSRSIDISSSIGWVIVWVRPFSESLCPCCPGVGRCLLGFTIIIFALPQARASVSCNVLVLDEVMGGMDAITISNRSTGISSSIGWVFIWARPLI